MEIVKKDEINAIVPGVEVELRGKKYVLAEVPMEFFRKNKDYWEKLNEQSAAAFEAFKTSGAWSSYSLVEALDRWAPFLVASFKINHPEIDAPQLDKLIGRSTLNVVIDAALEANGMNAKQAEGEAGGEAGESKPAVN